MISLDSDRQLRGHLDKDNGDDPVEAVPIPLSIDDRHAGIIFCLASLSLSSV